jgi:hypothetical protein
MAFGSSLPPPRTLVPLSQADFQDASRPPTARELLLAYSAMRGFKATMGQPDISRGARIVLKDYVKVGLSERRD